MNGGTLSLIQVVEVERPRELVGVQRCLVERADDAQTVPAAARATDEPPEHPSHPSVRSSGERINERSTRAAVSAGTQSRSADRCRTTVVGALVRNRAVLPEQVEHRRSDLDAEGAVRPHLGDG